MAMNKVFDRVRTDRQYGTPPVEERREAFRVKFEEDDPNDPHNFHSAYKAWLLAQMALLAFVGSLGSSIISPATVVLSQKFDISQETTVLAVSLFVLGYAFGPMIWAPISECYGRKVSMVPAVFVLGLFSIGSAASEGAVALFVTRFFGGLFASAPISNVAAALGDLYLPKTRGVPTAILALCVVGGPCLAPVIGSALMIHSRLGWRWTLWLLSIIAFASVLLTFVCLPETYAPVLLKRKARAARKETGDSRYWHPQEDEAINLNNIITKYLSRPLRMLFTEPAVTCFALYASFIYGLLFFQLEAFQVVFYEQRGWSLLVSSLPFLALLVGVLFALFINIANQPLYARAVSLNQGRAVPEARLPPVVVGGFIFSIGLFWFGWTSDPAISWISPVFAAGFIGAGFNITFQQCLNFLIDTYGPFAASALAANTFLRSLLACGLPLAARPMFHNLEVGPACSILGGLSCLALPVPFIFMKYGKQLRDASKFALEDQDK